MNNMLKIFPILLFLTMMVSAQTTVPFEQFFENASMRIDYYHIADAQSEMITLDKIYRQGIWAGSKRNLIDQFNQGRYYFKIYDRGSGQLIYSRGFDSYCGEYRTSSAAQTGVKRSYHESAIIPYPRNKITFTLESRDRQNQLHLLFSQEIDPKSLDINTEAWIKGVKVCEALKNGEPATKVDMAIIGEGYTATDEAKFIEDLNKFSGLLFAHEPYKSFQTSFNIYGVLKFSDESGTDDPRAQIYQSTALNTTFNSLGSDRYILTEDNESLRDIAAHVPYDALLIMINHKKYGGGGIYNFYLTFTTDNQWHEYIFIHEFGHSFAGLADEYYTSSTAYNEFYPSGIEPVEPNITALLDPANVKWKDLLSPKIKIPTPWEKEAYDQMDLEYQKVREELTEKIAKLKREKAPQDVIQQVEDESENLSRSHALKVDTFLQKSKYFGKVGVFEGAGYASKGLYRPMIDCMMFTKGNKSFCKVCENSIIEVIKYYTE
jgi:IgA Peptidase M64/Peptidase M64 N-terminus